MSGVNATTFSIVIVLFVIVPGSASAPPAGAARAT
jgi:hypothetical protein